MKLAIDYLVLNNFKSFPQLTLHLDKFGSGLHFLGGINRLDKRLGSNGVGKSSVWDAVCWCLYGRTVRGLKATDVRPWVGKGSTQVLVQVNGKDVLRQTNPSRLMVAGKDASQETIDELVGLNFDTFVHTIVLGQGQPLFFDLPPRQKMDLFSTVLNLDRWDARADTARAKVGRLEKLEARLQGELSTMSNRKAMVATELKQLKERSDEWAEDNIRKLEELEVLIREARKRIDKLQAEHDRADLGYDGAMMELKACDKGHSQLLQQMNAAQLEWDQHDLTIAVLREERDQIDFDLGLNPEKCSKCGQPLGDKAYKHMRNKMLDRYDDLEDEIKADKKGPALLARVQEVRQEEERLRATTDGFKQLADKHKATLDMTTPLLAELKALVSTRDQAEEELRDAENPYHQQLQARRKESKRLEGDIEDHEARLDKLKGQIARTKFWVKGFRDVRLYVVDALMQELEMATNAMLPEVGLPDWVVRYDVERETKSGGTARGLNTTILSPDNEQPVKWESWSGGEGQRLRLVGALAFSDVLLRHSGVQPTLEVLDEPTQHLSVEGVRDLVDFLQGRAKALERALFYVDHQSVDSARFDSVTTIVKDSKGSRLLSTPTHVVLASP